jgi:phage/conjugal plasmid C-4 type zinc finger TraR family protein
VQTFIQEGLIMANGWSRDGAVQDQIDASVEEAIQLARSRLPTGKSLAHCAECGATIPVARRKAIPGVKLCVNCQVEHDGE